MMQQDKRYFAHDIFKWLFVNGEVCIVIEISLKFVSKRSIDNKLSWLIHALNSVLLHLIAFS